MKIRLKPKAEEIEAISFDELVEHGRSSGVPIFNGMPWSFDYKGFPVTHENDNRYIVANEHFERGDMLVSHGTNQPVPFSFAEFSETYEVQNDLPLETQIQHLNIENGELVGSIERLEETARIRGEVIADLERQLFKAVNYPVDIQRIAQDALAKPTAQGATPRTDACLGPMSIRPPARFINFARQLERELETNTRAWAASAQKCGELEAQRDAALAALNRAEKYLCQTCGGSGVIGSPPDDYRNCPDCTGKWQRMVDDLAAQRKACEVFRAALVKISTEPDYTNPEGMVRIARAALAQGK